MGPVRPLDLVGFSQPHYVILISEQKIAALTEYFGLKENFFFLTRLGLTQNLEPARELRTFHKTGTVKVPSSWNTDTKHGITLHIEVS